MVCAMSPAELLGYRVTLRILRLAAPGAFLAIDATAEDPEAPTVLLPHREVPPDVGVGDPVTVFVHLDSDDRPIATTVEPRLTLGEVTFLTCTATTPIGAFFDWGLGKELLVPFAQQSKELHVGERQPIGLYLDNTGRLAGTMHVSELLDRRPRQVALDDWMMGEAWRNDPDIGLFAILERSFVGLVPATEPHALRRGDTAKFRVTNVLADGKLVLSLRQHAYQELENDAAAVLAVLGRPGAPRVGDRSSPDTIRDLFGISKKAFKRAVGRLLKDRAIELDPDGTVLVVRREPPA